MKRARGLRSVEIGKRSLGFSRPRPPVSPPQAKTVSCDDPRQNPHLFPREVRSLATQIGTIGGGDLQPPFRAWLTTIARNAITKALTGRPQAG